MNGPVKTPGRCPRPRDLTACRAPFILPPCQSSAPFVLPPPLALIIRRTGSPAMRTVAEGNLSLSPMGVFRRGDRASPVPLRTNARSLRTEAIRPIRSSRPKDPPIEAVTGRTRPPDPPKTARQEHAGFVPVNHHALAAPLAGRWHFRVGVTPYEASTPSSSLRFSSAAGANVLPANRSLILRFCSAQSAGSGVGAQVASGSGSAPSIP